MFSGIITGLEKAVHIEKTPTSMRLNLSIPAGWKLEVGESIAVDGICGTIERLKKNLFYVFYMQETLRKTALSTLSKDHAFNLEQPLSLQTLISGHLVSGHIDSTATVTNLESEGEAKVVTFTIPQEFSKYLVYKGSVAVNGVSLTVVESNAKTFTVSLIPFTQEKTNLGALQKGDVVNIEYDMIAKYLEKLI